MATLRAAAVDPLPAPSETLAIDFANTRYWRGSRVPSESLTGPADLVDWAGSTALVPVSLVQRCRARWAAHPKEGEAALADALGWREAIYRALAAASAGAEVSPDDVARLNAALARAPVRQRLGLDPDGPGGGGRGWAVGAVSPSGDALLAPVLWSAGDLLTGGRLDKVRRCANPECGWLFLDDSRAGKRRWCSMSSCGNRAKARRHYHKSRAEG